ncbi:DUF4405 domain-containing protein [Pseudooceanicola spongiae]|nr:DUF4405 domain-containing protein [Pseudooceanicola spongiae]
MHLALRKWATPMVASTFLITGVTGVALYFHSGGTLSRDAHIWVGFAVLAVAVLHIVMNWRPVKGYLKRPLPAAILALGVVATVLSSVTLTPTDPDVPTVNPGMVFGALTTAPVSALAQLVGKQPDAFVATLQAQGFSDASLTSTIADLSHGDAGLRNRALGLAFAKGAQPSS